MKSINKEDAWIRTYTGGKVYYFHPEKSKIDIEDVAHSLSLLCRFNGATKEFYSVAQHSVFVAEAVKNAGGSPDDIYSALLHDASEAFISDVPSPFKKFFPGFKKAEVRMEKWLAEKFKFKFPYSQIVKDYDLVALATEMRDLMNVCDNKTLKTKPLNEKIKPLNPNKAKQLFLKKYECYRNY
jgi:5'-deoxynucleotidase YfbR-like HD superfamily hydrolase